MKTKLLRKLREQGRNQITILSVTTTKPMYSLDKYVSGMSYSYPDDAYRHLFNFGNTAEDVIKKAEKIYMNLNMDNFREKYKKYSVKNKK